MLHLAESKIGFAAKWSRSTSIVASSIRYVFFQFSLKNISAMNAGAIR
jgi:hypothetical protein